MITVVSSSAMLRSVEGNDCAWHLPGGKLNVRNQLEANEGRMNIGQRRVTVREGQGMIKCRIVELRLGG